MRNERENAQRSCVKKNSQGHRGVNANGGKCWKRDAGVLKENHKKIIAVNE